MTKRILVTGAGGFVGKHLITAIQKSQADSEIFGNIYSPTSDLAALLDHDHLLPTDLTNFAETVELIKQVKPDVIYHLASLSVVQDSGAKAGIVLSNNLTLQYNLLEAVRLYSPSSRLIIISSGNIYGSADPSHIPMREDCPLKPLNPYAVSKLSQEFLSLQYYLAYGIDIVILRPFNHTGAGQTTDFIIPLLAKQFADIKKHIIEPTITIGNGSSQRDFTDVRDMCEAYLLAAEHGISGEVYNLGTGIGASVNEIISYLEELSGIKVQVQVDPDRVRSADVPVLVCDSTKFRALTGWSPKIPLRDTLKSILDYWENNYAK